MNKFSFNNTLYLLTSLFLISSYFIITSTSILALFISIELLSFIIIILINLFIQDQYPGILYFLISGIFTGIFLLSLGYLYIGFNISYKLLYLVFLFKLGILPFHFILPSIYLNLSIKLIYLIDIPYKLIIFYILYKFTLINLSL